MAKLGLQIPFFSWDGAPDNHREKLRAIASTAEEEGFSSLWVMDHFFQLPMIGEPDLDMHEGYTTLGFLAGVTERIELGTMVTGVTYRHPAVLVKQVTSLDVLSGGRAILGIGAAWFDREHTGLGIPFPPLKERFERLEDALEIAHRMWSDSREPFEGKHTSVPEPICVPAPLRRPHPPILIGGGGERKTLRLVARFADAWNVACDAETYAHKLGILEGHCAEVGRDYGEIEKTWLGTAWPNADLGAEAQGMVDAGAEHLIFNMPSVEDLDPIRRVAREVRSAVGS